MDKPVLVGVEASTTACWPAQAIHGPWRALTEMTSPSILASVCISIKEKERTRAYVDAQTKVTR